MSRYGAQGRSWDVWGFEELAARESAARRRRTRPGRDWAEVDRLRAAKRLDVAGRRARRRGSLRRSSVLVAGPGPVVRRRT